MSVAVWNFPTKIIFGEGSIEDLGREAKRLGAKHALIVSDPGVVAAGLTEEAGRSLKLSEISYGTFDGISSNPKESEVKKATEAFTAAKADLVIAIGGGSALDVAKMIRLCAAHTGSLEEYEESNGGEDKITKPMAPMIAVPTTAGTGSEVGRAAVATLTSTNAKAIFFSPRLIPDVAVLDPRLSVSMPPTVTAATGFDALTHNIEAYCAKGDHPLADGIALYAIELIATHLEKAVEHGEDLQARGAMLKGAMMGAVAFQKGLGACHSLAHPLSAKYDLHHGLANALCLPAVIDFNRKTITERIARVARILGARGDNEDTLAFECSGAIRKLRKSVGLPEGLAAAEINEEDIPELAPLAFADGCHRSNPRSCTVEDMAALYEASL